MAPDSVQEIRRRMAEVRGLLGREVQSLATSAKAKTDWHYYYRQHPWLFAGAAVALGYLIVPAPARTLLLGAEAFAKFGRRGKTVELGKEKTGAGLIAGTLLPILTRFAATQAATYIQRFKEQHRAKQEESKGPLYSFRAR